MANRIIKTKKESLSKNAKSATKVKKNEPQIAYLDQQFLEGDAGRQVRILSEFLAPGERFATEKIQNSIVFFGSARTLPTDEIKKRKKTAKGKELKRLKSLENVAEYYDAARNLARRLGKWCNSQQNRTRPSSYKIDNLFIINSPYTHINIIRFPLIEQMLYFVVIHPIGVFSDLF